MTGWRFLAGSAAALAAAAALAGPPRLDALVVSEKKGGGHATSFAPNTARIYLAGNLLDTPPGTKLKTIWVAESTLVAPTNYVIDSLELAVGSVKEPRFEFSIARPTAGWPLGDYRVDLLVNGKKTTEVKFKIK